MGRWTPLGPKHEGLVWPALRSADVLLATEGSLVGVILPSTVTEEIAAVHTLASTRTSWLRLAVDVYATLGDATAHGGARSARHQMGGGSDVSPGGWYTMVTRQNDLSFEQADAEAIDIGTWWVAENDPPDVSSVGNSNSGPFGIAKNGVWTVELKRDDGAIGTGRAKAWMNRSLVAADIASATGHAVTPGLPYTFAAFAQSAPGDPGPKSVRVGISWWNAAGTAFLGESLGDPVTANQDNMLARPIVQHSAPAGAGRGIPFIEIVFTNPAADSSQSVFFDGMMRTQAIQLPGDYIDPGIDFEVGNSTGLAQAVTSGVGIRATGTGFNEVEFPIQIDSGTYDGKRIAGLKLTCVARSVGGLGNLWMSLRVNGNLYRGTTLGVGDDQRTRLTHESYWSRNPDTGEPWTVEDIEMFATAENTATMHWEGGNELSTIEVESFMAELFYVDETRIATGHSDFLDPGGDPADVQITLDETFIKNDSDAPFIVFRKDAVTQGIVRLHRLDSGMAVMPLGWAGIIPAALSVNGFGDVGIIDRFPTFPNRAVPLVILEQADESVSVDSQPYAVIAHDPVGTSEQEFTPETTMSAGVIVAAVRVTQPTLDVPDLVLMIREGHDGTILAAAVIRADELDDPVDQFQIVARTFVDVTLTAGTQYVIEASSAAPANDFFPHWELAALQGGVEDAWNERGYGGVTDVFTHGTEQTSKDAVAWVGTKPAAVTLDAIEAASHPSRISVAWSESDEADFWYYELQRSDSVLGYVTVARFFERTASGYVDGAGLLGAECSYRVRVVRTDWAPSEWSDELTATMPPITFPFGAGECETRCFYSLSAPGVAADRWVEVGDLSDGKRTYRNPDDLTVVDLAGADTFGRSDSVAFRSPGRVLDRFSIAAMVYGGDGPFQVPAELVGRVAFSDLVDLSFADAPYVVVRDSDGNRWYSAIKCNEQVREEPGGIYTVDVDVAELTRAPFPLQLIEGDEFEPPVSFSDHYAEDVGDGESTLITVTHNLHTRDVLVRVYSNSAPFARVIVANSRPTIDTVVLDFEDEPPGVDAYRVVIFA
jgi:hypothetical protein